MKSTCVDEFKKLCLDLEALQNDKKYKIPSSEQNKCVEGPDKMAVGLLWNIPESLNLTRRARSIANLVANARNHNFRSVTIEEIMESIRRFEKDSAHIKDKPMDSEEIYNIIENGKVVELYTEYANRLGERGNLYDRTRKLINELEK